MCSSPKFSIIIPDYEKSVSRKYAERCLKSLQVQTFGEYEVLLYHDGPKEKSYADEFDFILGWDRCRTCVTEQRYNDWGHSLRDIGIRASVGEYIVHLNADNVLYPFALEKIVEEMAKHRSSPFDSRVNATPDLNTNDIVIFPVLMIGVQGDGTRIWQETRDNPALSIIMTGYPAYPGFIDCMQLVMKRSVWLQYGGWYDKSMNSDGVLYTRFVNERRAKYVPAVLGEHW
ncbi:MAG: glycosyltransferase [Acidiferrobacterales bacterium]